VAIVNVTSRLGFMPSALVPTYCGTKAALHSYTQSLRFQLRDTSVQVIEIIPAERANRTAGRARIQRQRGASGRVHSRNDDTVADAAAGCRDSRRARQAIPVSPSETGFTTTSTRLQSGAHGRAQGGDRHLNFHANRVRTFWQAGSIARLPKAGHRPQGNRWVVWRMDTPRLN
jgi:NAD(P)-dependent dehydrogenase (short-subunit alcohol dehydrogenase family)